jgi:cytochrome P450
MTSQEIDAAGPGAAETRSPSAGVPVLSINPFGEAFLADPYAYHEHLREAGSIVWIEPLGVYATARHAEVSAALNDWQTFISGRGVGLSDFVTEKPWRPRHCHWKRIHRFMAGRAS